MNTFQWTYIGDYNKNYHIGVYHSSQSGNLVIHCNGKIIIIDFKVLASKTYSFFIGEELCELEIERSSDSFKYGMKINKDADTPRNRTRKSLERRDLTKSVLSWAAVIAVVILFSYMLHI